MQLKIQEARQMLGIIPVSTQINKGRNKNTTPSLLSCSKKIPLSMATKATDIPNGISSHSLL